MPRPSFRIAAVLSLAVLAASCAPDAPVPRAPTAEEYAVYRVVLSGGYATPVPTRVIVVGDSTIGIRDDGEFSDAAAVERTEPERAVRRDFLRRNAHPAALRADSFRTRLPVVLLSRTELARILDAKGGWEHFHDRYAGSYGYFGLSRVGFSRDGTRAVLIVERSCGFLCGSGHIVRLEKREGRWRVVESMMTWIA